MLKFQDFIKDLCPGNRTRGIRCKMKLQGSFYMGYFSTKQGFLSCFYTIDVEKTAKIDKILELLELSGVC